MTLLGAFFLAEADECMAVLRGELDRSDPDPAALHGAARMLRGSAQMARFGRIERGALELESRLKPLIPAGTLDSAALAGVREQVAVLGGEVDAVREGRVEQDARSGAAMDEQPRGGGEVEEVVEIGTLEYAREAALDRALELREPLEDAIVSENAPGPLLDELFDLIRLGRK